MEMFKPSLAGAYKGVTPLDIMKWQLQQKTADRRAIEERHQKEIDKIYDTALKVSMTDWGMYSDDVMKSYNAAVNKAAEDIKHGKPPAATLHYYDEAISNMKNARQVMQDEKTFAEYVNSSKYLTAEAKQQAINDRAKEVFYDEEGNLKPLKDAAKTSKNAQINISKYIDNETLYKDFVNSTPQFNTSKAGPNGSVHTYSLFPWQKVGDNGETEIDLDADGLVSADVFSSFMSSKVRADKVNSEIDALIDQGKVKEDDEVAVQKAQRTIVTDILKSRGTAGASHTLTRQYVTPTPKPKNPSAADTRAAGNRDIVSRAVETYTYSPENATTFFADGQKKGTKIDSLSSYNTNIKEAYITDDGSVYVKYNTKDLLNKFTKFNSMKHFFLVGTDPKFQLAAGELYPDVKNVNGVVLKAEATKPSDYIGMTDQNGKIKDVDEQADGSVTVKYVDGEQTKYFRTFDEMKAQTKIQPDSTASPPKIPAD